MRIALVIAAIALSAATAGAQDVTTTIVPIVGTTYGPTMIRWLTDVEIVNDSRFDTDVAIELSAIPTAPAFAFTLGPGQSQRFTDIVGQAFGLDSAISPLRVTTAGRRPITVRAQAYAMRGTDASPPQPLGVYGTGTWFPLRALDNLSFSDDFRTNIGLVNAGETDADFLVALQRVPGRNLAVTYVRVPPGAIRHSSIQSLFPMITNGHGFSVVVETANRDTLVYASVIENINNAGTFVAPRNTTR
jgi:hypothetical protein